MIELIVPSDVEVAESLVDILDAPLFSEEQATVVFAVSARRREFSTTRHCARLALARIGVTATTIAVGANREPQWPPGIMGSITHCTGLRAAAVCRHGTVDVLGIDAEPDGPLPAGVLSIVACNSERSWVSATRDLPVHADRLLFSIKESVYKAWFPLMHSWLSFEDVEVVVDVENHSFEARLVSTGPSRLLRSATDAQGFTGRWTYGKGLLATAVTGLL